jgi:hypothetical protein
MRIASEINVDNMLTPELNADEVAHALSFLTPEKIMTLRCVNMTWKDAAKKTIAPATDFLVNNERRYNAMRVMARALPNLQQITLGPLGQGHKWSDGEDPDQRQAARSTIITNRGTHTREFLSRFRRIDYTANWTAHDIEIISNFSKLQILGIDGTVGRTVLDGRYPVLFNSFPLLQNLRISCCDNLKWDLEMLAGLPLLKELDCESNRCLTGNINSLRVLKGTLEKVTIEYCDHVEGSFMDLADFPHLKKLDLDGTAVTGDIRDISESDFSLLEQLFLPKGVYGGHGCELRRISDGPDLVRAVYLLKKQRPTLSMDNRLRSWLGVLSGGSPEWYGAFDDGFEDVHVPPFHIWFVQAGSRIGYRWGDFNGDDSCEVNWLDPEPDRESSDYGNYIEELEEISQVTFYRGFHQPPTEEEYLELVFV